MAGTIQTQAKKPFPHPKAAMVQQLIHMHPNTLLESLSFKSSPCQPLQTSKQLATADLEHYNTDVVNALRSSNIERLRELLYQEDQCFDACNNNGEYLIHLACRRSDLKTIQFLVQEARVNMNVRDTMGRSILHDVCWRPRMEADIFGFLVQHVDPSFLLRQDARGHTPFDYSRKADWPKWNKFVVQHRQELRKFLSAC
mmetsp:Transcript_4662/g.6062  ORF Transcript_4662/g.6062 Transcript_4662/m.6062 type:complete len:199 (-) Transcript_4662:94-690(-)|eukprot:CAMPEP_0198154554 /NCGR_PEP_ID=MMETSP1443-20131203/68657_1 /TAXON_ID=186043 /ORGANISM="Entomoneis sp., Strain CCMP2396" /LENGTH=198 /DNA_ID=CAMNT_0043821233 /DNA_START=505 /DNA_END=1101 /DNA_ORIENTATION=-